jgi:hypothetical protein
MVAFFLYTILFLIKKLTFIVVSSKPHQFLIKSFDEVLIFINIYNLVCINIILIFALVITIKTKSYERKN